MILDLINAAWPWVGPVAVLMVAWAIVRTIKKTLMGG